MRACVRAVHHVCVCARAEADTVLERAYCTYMRLRYVPFFEMYRTHLMVL